MCLYLVENPKKKESVDSELARGRVSKFYWLVVLRSQAWVLVSVVNPRKKESVNSELARGRVSKFY